MANNFKTIYKRPDHIIRINGEDEEMKGDIYS
jgi:hypothetical protein